MSIIKKLPLELVEKIAAGEVVERPASIVKELVENAIDAKATHIDVLLTQGGIGSIEIKDDGLGMSKDDLLMAVEPHATSKLSHADDLFALTSLGFRGEALASICAVSKVILKSKKNSQNLEAKSQESQRENHSVDIGGYELHIEGGVKFPLKSCAMNRGTHIYIWDIFFNVPARKKFLKSQSTELSVILELMEHFLLSYPHISFRVLHNQKLVLHSPKGDVISAMRDIYGPDIAKGAISVDSSDVGMSLTGIIVKPSLVRSDRKGMSLYVNGRIVKNTEIYNAVLEGYDTLLMVGKFPYVALHLRLDPQTIDVNVHPRKDIIKIDAEKLVLAFITKSVSAALESTNLLRTATTDTLHIQTQIDAQKHSTDFSIPKISEQIKSYSSSDSKLPRGSSDLETLNESPSNKPLSLTAQSQSVLEKSSDVIHTTSFLHSSQPRELFSASKNVDNLETPQSIRYIGLLHKTYGLCEDYVGLVLVDFHAAHERYHYELFMDQYYKKTLQLQELLTPLVVELSASEFTLFSEFRDKLASFGFLCEEFGHNCIVVRSVPHILGRLIDTQYIHELLQDFSQARRLSLDVLEQTIITSMSCKASDKAGDDLSSERVKQLIQFVLSTKQKYACPHGRPTFVRLSYAELEKMFKRRV
jgi:DNA mismatch repair protein MutL